MANSSITVTKIGLEINKERIDEYTFDWVADDSDGSIPVGTTQGAVKGFIQMAEVTTGTNPTALYDIAVKNDNSVDLFGGELDDLSAAGGEQITPKVGNAWAFRPVNTSVLTVTITGNSVNSATGKFIIYVHAAHVN